MESLGLGVLSCFLIPSLYEGLALFMLYNSQKLLTTTNHYYLRFYSVPKPRVLLVILASTDPAPSVSLHPRPMEATISFLTGEASFSRD